MQDLPQSPLLRLVVSPAFLGVRAGEEAVFVLTIENRGAEAQMQTVGVDGLPPWWRLDFDAQHQSFPGERRTATLYVAIPAAAAGNEFQIEFTVRAGSAESKIGCGLQVRTAAAPPIPAQAAQAPSLSLTPSAVVWQGEAQGFERIQLSIGNPGAQPADYLLALEGLERGWYTLPARVRVQGGQSQNFELRLSPPPRARPGDYAFSVQAQIEGNPASFGRAEGRLTVGAPEQAPRQQRGISPVAAEPQPMAAPRAQSEPVLPPEVSLGPRTTFRFGQGEIAAQAVITIQNRSRLIERYEVTIRGLSADWYTLTMTDVRLEPGASTQVPLRLTPKVGPDAPAGDYPFTIRVAPHTYPDSFAEVGGTVAMVGVASFDARLVPAQTAGRKEKFKLTLLNTGGVPLSLWLEASDPEGLCNFKYAPPDNLDPGQETVVPIWVGANRQGFAGVPKRLDFRVRVSPAGGASQQARSFDARFVHTPFLGAKTVGASAFFAFVAMIIGLVAVMGTSSVSNAVTSVSCGLHDDYHEFKNGPDLVNEDCGGAPVPCQKKTFCAGVTKPDLPVQPTATATARPGVTPTVGPTATRPACAGAADLGLSIGKNVTLLTDARIRTDGGTSFPQVALGANRQASIIGGPKCADSLVWWNVDLGNVKGWTAERNESGVQLIIPR